MEYIQKDQGVLSRIELSNGVSFEVVHNLDAFGQDLGANIDAWATRNQVYWRRPKWTAESFCKYVMYKKALWPDLFCVPKSKFDKICKEQGFNPKIV